MPPTKNVRVNVTADLQQKGIPAAKTPPSRAAEPDDSEIGRNMGFEESAGENAKYWGGGGNGFDLIIGGAGNDTITAMDGLNIVLGDELSLALGASVDMALLDTEVFNKPASGRIHSRMGAIGTFQQIQG